MLKFINWLENYDSNSELNQESLPPGAFLEPIKLPRIQYLKIDFFRSPGSGRASGLEYYRNIYIPFGKSQLYKDSQSALKIAQKIVLEEKNNYTRVTIFKMTASGCGNSLFHDENSNEFFSGYHNVITKY